MRLRRVLALLAPSLALTLAASPALAAPHVTLSARFEPDQLGQSTTILYEFSIARPLPVKSVDLRLPAGMELATSSLGLSECPAEVLKWEEPQGCPPNSILGHGTAFAEVPLSFRANPIQEPATVTAALGPAEGEDPTILFLVEGTSPVSSILVLPSKLTPTTGRFSASLSTQVPLLSAWLEGPYISLTRFTATIGPKGITYYHRRHGHLVGFHPKGIAVPDRCPPHGFPFQVEFTFYNGQGASATSYAPCPQRHTPPPTGARNHSRHRR